MQTMQTVEYKVDLCVVGGGMAGLCAATSAGRHGASVVLMQERPMLGGNASSENRMWVCGAQGRNNRETGIIEEIMLENLYRNPTKNFYIWDTILLDFIKREPNITLLLNTTCMDADVEEGVLADGRTRRILSVKGYQMTTQRFIRVHAKYFADCSGDSILAPLSGAEFDFGRESADEYGEQTQVSVRDRKMMGMSCLIEGRQTEHSVRFTPSEFVTRLTDEQVKNRPMNLYSTLENFWYLELGGDKDTVNDAEAVKEELIPLALGAWDYLKNSGKYDADKWELEFLGLLPAKRESRRMRGEYTVTQRDISADTVFPDTVAFGGWPLDDHDPLGYYHKGKLHGDVPTPAPYCLPYRALYSKNVENLYFAGRNISMTHMAMSSIRVMATCALLGQAVGTAASVAARHGTTPHGVYLSHLSELQTLLLNDDCFLPHLERRLSDVCRTATLVGADGTIRSGRDRANRIYGTETCGTAVKNGTRVTYRLPAATAVASVHLVFDSDLDRETLPGDRCEQMHNTRANILLDSPQMHLPTTLCRAFDLVAETADGTLPLLSVRENRRRAYHVTLPAGVKVTALSLTPLSSWGDGEHTRIISFDFN